MIVKFRAVGRAAFQYTASTTMHGEWTVSKCSAHRDDPELLRLVLIINGASYTIHGQRDGSVVTFCHNLYNITVAAGSTVTAYIKGYDNTPLSTQRVLQMMFIADTHESYSNPIQTVVFGKRSGEMVMSYHHHWEVLHSVIFDETVVTPMLKYPLPYRFTIRYIRVHGNACELLVRTQGSVITQQINSLQSVTIETTKPQLVLLDAQRQPIPWGDNWLIVATTDTK